jgi:hypothetical protein
MIYFFNGAAKHASFFQMFIIQKALDQVGKPFSRVKNTFFHRHHRKSAKRQLKELASACSDLFLIKGHWGEPCERDLLLMCDNIKIFLIWRDFRDVLVSQFFFEQNKFGKRFADFDDYYWRYLGGRYNLLQHLKYKRCWDSAQDERSIYVAHFHELKTNFASAADRMLQFAGIDGVDLAQLEQEVTVARLRDTTGDKAGAHFRKGIIGDYKSIITSKHTIDDIRGLSAAAEKNIPASVLASMDSFRRSPVKTALVKNFAHGIARRAVVQARAFL